MTSSFIVRPFCPLNTLFDFTITSSLILIRPLYPFLVFFFFFLWLLKNGATKFIASAFLFSLYDLLALLWGVCPFIWITWSVISANWILFFFFFKDRISFIFIFVHLRIHVSSNSKAHVFSHCEIFESGDI